MKNIFVCLFSLMILHADVFAGDDIPIEQAITDEFSSLAFSNSIDQKLAHRKQQLLWLKKNETKCILGSAYSFVFLISYVPFDLICQVFQYYCLEGTCHSDEVLIRRQTNEDFYACCYMNGIDSTCARMDAGKSSSAELYYRKNCDKDLPSDLIGQIIPCETTGIGIDSLCFKEVLLIPSIPLFCGLVAEVSYTAGAVIFYGARLIQQHRVNTLEAKKNDCEDIHEETCSLWNCFGSCLTWIKDKIICIKNALCVFQE